MGGSVRFEKPNANRKDFVPPASQHEGVGWGEQLFQGPQTFMSLNACTGAKGKLGQGVPEQETSPFPWILSDKFDKDTNINQNKHSHLQCIVWEVLNVSLGRISRRLLGFQCVFTTTSRPLRSPVGGTQHKDGYGELFGERFFSDGICSAHEKLFFMLSNLCICGSWTHELVPNKAK